MSDLAHAIRQLRHAPGFACAVVVTLALTVGANTAMFSLVNAIILRTLPVQDPERIVVLQARDARGVANRPIYYSTFAGLAKLPVFESLSLYSGGGLLQLEVRGGRAEGVIEASTPGLFESIGLRPYLGRFFSSDDVVADGPSAPVVVISYDLWRRTFGSDPSAIGETIRISGAPATVIGVTPPHYKGFYVDGGLGFSVPLSFLNHQIGTDPKRPVRGLNAVGRLAPGTSIAQARAAVDAVWPALRVETVPAGLSTTEQAEIPTQQMSVESLATGFSSLRRQYRDPLLLVFGISAALLLIGCVNLSGLLLSRTSARQHHFAIQLALGASRVRLARQLLAEHLLLCGGGTALGVLIAWWTTVAASRLLWRSAAPLSQTLTPDARVLVFAALVALVSAVFVTLLPAWALGRNRPLTAMQASRTVAHGAGRWSQVLLVTQIATSLVLVVGAALLGASLVKLRTMPTGVQHDGLRWSRLFAVPNGYRDLHDASYYPELVRRLSEVPGVQSVALAGLFPTFFAFENLLAAEQVAPVDAAAGNGETGALMERVTPRFFETSGTPLLGGRDFTWGDDKEHAQVAIINEALSRALFPAGNAIGRYIRIGKDPSRAAVEIVGVVGDAVIGGFKQPHAPVVFRPRLQDAISPRAPVMLFRTSVDPVTIDAAMTEVIDGLGREYPRRFYSLNEQIDVALLRERLLAALSSFFAGLAALLAFVGLYSALALAVARRTREVGVRMALGATRASVIRMVIADGARISVAGVALGIPAALAASGLVSSWVFGVQATNPTALVAAGTFFIAIGIIAGLRPALRASSVDPATVLRAEQW